jgi:hypothetical protein
MSLIIAPDLKATLLTAVKAAIDSGTGGYVAIFDASEQELGRVVLAVPCGTVADGKLTLNQADAGADMVTATGTAAWAEVRDSSDTALLAGACTGADGAGPFKIGGSGIDLLLGSSLVLAGLAVE